MESAQLCTGQTARSRQKQQLYNGTVIGFSLPHQNVHMWSNGWNRRIIHVTVLYVPENTTQKKKTDSSRASVPSSNKTQKPKVNYLYIYFSGREKLTNTNEKCETDRPEGTKITTWTRSTFQILSPDHTCRRFPHRHSSGEGLNSSTFSIPRSQSRRPADRFPPGASPCSSLTPWSKARLKTADKTGTCPSAVALLSCQQEAIRWS